MRYTGFTAEVWRGPYSMRQKLRAAWFGVVWSALRWWPKMARTLAGGYGREWRYL